MSPANQPFLPPLPKKTGDKITWGQALGIGRTLAVAEAACALAGSGLVICSSMAEAYRVEQDLALLLKDRPGAPRLSHFADWETLPYDNFSPHQDIISARMRCLFELAKGDRCLVVVSAATLMQRLAPKPYILGNSLVLAKGGTLQLDTLRSQLVAAGYRAADTVFQHGEFAIRGGLLDIFPMGSPAAYRIELFDNEIESLREFDPDTQRTVQAVERIDLLPAKECPLDRAAVSLFKTQWMDTFDSPDPKRCPLYQDVASGLSPAGVEYYLPLFFEKTASLFDYLPVDTCTFVLGDLEAAIDHFWKEAQSRYSSRCGDRLRPILEPQKLFLPVNEVFAALKPLSRISLQTSRLDERAGHTNLPCQALSPLHLDHKSSEPLQHIQQLVQQGQQRLLFCAETAGRREALLDLLARIGVRPQEFDSAYAFCQSQSALGITLADFETGLSWGGMRWVAEAEIFGLRVQQKRRRSKGQDDHDNIIKNLTELKLDAPVVHIDHGVGRYRGLQSIDIDQQLAEFLVLEYADHAKLYVPVANLHVISRYSGSDDEHAPLHRLGGDTWAKAKRKAAEQIRDVAAELLEIYAKRRARKGTAFDDPAEAYAQFASGFPFEETPDQEAAIEAVRNDMLSPEPMDRLVCGDVGFGKTEVAMRAAFIAVQNSRQVLVLVPTTLLAQQHYENFKDRFADWPVNVDVVSRFRSSKETSEVRERLANGRVDILIGTHKLLQADIKAPNLGLLIIDEEHRFGVRQKETLKALRAEVDILTMTATPIPRTLNMAMNGIRDLSIIATPPAKRLSIKTFVRESDDATIKEAILREILRGGQVYFLHNEVKTIEKTAANLAALVPEARIQIGHGQMRERELEAVMSDFYHKRFNVLVCTTIIETGIDVPNANTIIIDRADKFGLAQLHQLRGRVGRSHHQAYAYLLTANAKSMTDDAHKRLNAIMEAQDLGAGFTLASHDLEIRGAGELLGEDQSGQIQTIGFSLYMDMLDRAVKALRQGKVINLDEPAESPVDINLRIPALLPDDYLPDVHSRLILYKRIASLTEPAQLDELQVEMIDRFGLLPEPAKHLLRVAALRMQAHALGIVKIEANRSYGRIEFGPQTRIDPLRLVKLVQQQPQHFKFDGATHLRYTFTMETSQERLATCENTLKALT
jgi:transcription-repair coupling factor (superfamily II helicase)